MLISREFYFEALGLAASLGISLFVLIALALRLRETAERTMFLWAMFAFFTINSLDMIDSLAYGPGMWGPLALYQWQDVLIPGFMIALYFFVRGLTQSNPRLRWADAVHLLPIAAAFCCLLPALSLPGDVRAGLREAETNSPLAAWADIGETLFWILWVILLITYGGLCVRRLVLHKRNIRALYADLEGKTLRWLDGLVATILTLALLVIVDEVMILLGYPEMRAGLVSALFDIVLSGSFGVFALRANPPLPLWSEAVLETAHASETKAATSQPTSSQIAQDKSVSPKPAQARRYARSGLQPADLDRYAMRLERRMQDGKLWRNHALNLQGLATEIAVPPIHLSEVLNTKLSLSFYDYVNQWRVREACALLCETEQTVLEISEAVGFNAKSTFNSSFKKVMQQTPSQYRLSQITEK